MPKLPDQGDPLPPHGLPLARFQVSGPQEGQRLDKALEQAFPQLGLRARRRLWDWCRVLVNGKAARPGSVVTPGDTVAVLPHESEAVSTSMRDSLDPPCLARGDNQSLSPSAGFPLPRILAVSDAYLALGKASGVHTAHIAGSADTVPSLESALRDHWPDVWRDWLRSPEKQGQGDDPMPAPPLLLTRLDRETSGLVLAARSTEAATRFRLLEQGGQVRKRYFALVEGRVESPLRMTGRLLTDSRATTRVLDEADPYPVRHTRAWPVRSLEYGGALCSLLRVEIARGARHQIRAHLARAGYPLYGDRRYGARGGDGFFLHHAALDMPDFRAQWLPEWEFVEKGELEAGLLPTSSSRQHVTLP